MSQGSTASAPYTMKKGVYPIGCGIGDKDGRVFHVFTANRRYFDMVRLINFEMNEKRQSNM